MTPSSHAPAEESRVAIEGAFWGPRLKLIRERTLKVLQKHGAACAPAAAPLEAWRPTGPLPAHSFWVSPEWESISAASQMAQMSAQAEGDAATWTAAVQRVWDSIFLRRNYITGALSCRTTDGHDEFNLPNTSEVAETCSAVAGLLLNHQLLQKWCDSRLGDEMERSLYNVILGAISQEGKAFFHWNPLATDRANFSHPDGSRKLEREEWPECSGCPVNAARLLCGLERLIYSESSHSVAVHLFIQSQAELRLGEETIHLQLRTDYPWKPRVLLEVKTAAAISFELRVRLPGWCREGSLLVNGQPFEARLDSGYIVVNRSWAGSTMVELFFPMPPERVRAHPRVVENIGRVALQRGPLIYCVEEHDLDSPLDHLLLPAQVELIPMHEKNLLGGVTTLHGEASCLDANAWSDQLYDLQRPRTSPVPFKAIPFFARAHRGPAAMRVWLREA